RPPPARPRGHRASVALALARSRSAGAEAREVGRSLLVERPHALASLLRGGELVQAAERERRLAGEVLALLVERLLQEAQRGRRPTDRRSRAARGRRR